MCHEVDPVMLAEAAPRLLEALLVILKDDPCRCLDGDHHGDCDFCTGREAVTLVLGPGWDSKNDAIREKQR